MRILFVDAFHSFDQAALDLFNARGYDLTSIYFADDVVDLVSRNDFDCIFLDLSTVGDSLGLPEIRFLANKSGLALMGTSPVESLIAHSLSTGRLEFQLVSVLVSNIQAMAQPALLVATGVHTSITKAIKNHGLRTSTASTLQFAMNLIVDGWCQIVCLNAHIPGLIQPDYVAIAHQVGVRETAILASALHSAGIMLIQKPHETDEFVALIEHIANNRPIPCGLVENFASHRNPH